ncbi:MAG: nucleotidyltransferase family protein [Candidatus Anstonellales archaeon]
MIGIILAGGKGMRLRPYTQYVPKPLLKVGGREILYYVLRNAELSGLFSKVYIAASSKEQMSLFENFAKLNRFSFEAIPIMTSDKGTGDALRFIEKPREPFLIGAGDHLTNINLKEMYKQMGDSIGIIGLKKEEGASEYGIAEVGGGFIKGFKDKPVTTYYINTAIYFFSPKLYHYIKEGDDLSGDTVPRMLKAGEKIKHYIMNEDEYWMDIGRVKDYEKVKEFGELFAFFKKFI